MKAVVQRVSSASVRVDGVTVGECGPGLLVLVSAHRSDLPSDAVKLAQKIVGLRIFNDAEGRMNLNLAQHEGDAPLMSANLLAVSNFTVYGDASQSRRPSFTEAAGFDLGHQLFEAFVAALRAEGARVQTGVFGADMQVLLVNDGPVTLVVEVRPSGTA